MAFEQLSSTVAHQNPYYTVYHEQYRLPNGSTGDYYAVRKLRSVFVIPQLADGRFVLIKQFRYLLQADSIEFPAGGIHDTETIEQAAQRELNEETGFSGTVELLGTYAPCNGLSDEQCFVFYAHSLLSTKQQLDSTEAITTMTATLEELEEMITSDKISDGMTLASWQLFRSKHKL